MISLGIGISVGVLGVGVVLLMYVLYSRAKTKHLITPPTEVVSLSSSDGSQFWHTKRSAATNELDRVNEELVRLRHQEPTQAKILTRIRPFNPSKEKEWLDWELRGVTNTLHGYPRAKPAVIAMPEHRITLNQELARVEKELIHLKDTKFPRVKVKSLIPATQGHVRE